MKIKLDEQYVVDGNRYGIRLMKMTYDKKKGKDTPQNTFYFNSYGQAVAYYQKLMDRKKDITSLTELAQEVDNGYKKIETMVDNKLKEVGIE